MRRCSGRYQVPAWRFLPSSEKPEREALTNVKTSLVPAVIGYFMTSRAMTIFWTSEVPS